MTADQIAAKLRAPPRTPAEIWSLVQACDPRRQEIRARQEAIADSVQRPPERLKAQQTGPDAVHQLDVEIEVLQREYDYLHTLERLCCEAHERALDAQAAREIPLALRKIPAARDAVRKAAQALDESLAAFNSLMETAGNYSRAGLAFPMNDDQLAEIYQLRELVWITRNVTTMFPGGDDETQRKTYPRSWPLAFIQKGNTITTRKPPRFPDHFPAD